MTTAELKPTKPGSVTLESWEDLVFVVRELNRKDAERFYVRVRFGTFPSARFGPFEKEPQAFDAWVEIVEALPSQLRDLFSNLQGMKAGGYNLED